MAKDRTITRAARHLALPQIGEAGQARIASSSVLLIGVGGIGCAAATCLASSGVGKLVLVDFDTVDVTNLGRQPLYTPTDAGKLKVECAQARLQQINPDIEITAVSERLNDGALSTAVNSADVVLDGCDNFATRFAVNDACVRNNTCLVSGAAIRFEGQLAVFGPDYDSSPCYRCLYREADESLDDCSGNGVLGPVPAVIGSLMAVEALKFLAGMPVQNGMLSLYDGIVSEWRKIRIGKRSDCPNC